jgi:uncharacterized protein
MSAENVATVRSIYEEVNRGDVDAAVEQFDAQIEFDLSRSLNPDSGGTVLHGREEARKLLKSFLEPWESFEWLFDDFVEIGDSVIAVGTTRMRGKGSGVEVVAHGAQLWELRDGRPVAMRQCQSKEEALLVLFEPLHRNATEAFNEGDLDAALGGLPEDLEWHPFSTDPQPAVHRGPDEIKRWFEDYRSVFDEWRSVPEAYERAGEASILIHHVIQGTSRGAGVPVEVDVFEIWEFDGAQPVRVRQFDSRESALAAAPG